MSVVWPAWLFKFLTQSSIHMAATGKEHDRASWPSAGPLNMYVLCNVAWTHHVPWKIKHYPITKTELVWDGYKYRLCPEKHVTSGVFTVWDPDLDILSPTPTPISQRPLLLESSAPSRIQHVVYCCNPVVVRHPNQA